MSVFRQRGSIRRRSEGFTLIELLTVIAIIAVLATLLASALAGSKRKARQIACISNLRQIALATQMYLEDHRARPTGWQDLIDGKYLSGTNVFRCPEDKAGDWANRATGSRFGNAGMAPSGGDLPSSYLHPFNVPDDLWKVLMKKEEKLGVVVCQLHGLGRQNLNLARLDDFEGVIWRGQLDGAVVRRQVYWLPMTAPMGELTDGASLGYMQLFIDEL